MSDDWSDVRRLKLFDRKWYVVVDKRDRTPAALDFMGDHATFYTSLAAAKHAIEDLPAVPAGWEVVVVRARLWDE